MKFKFSRLGRAASFCLVCLAPPVFADNLLLADVCELSWGAPMSNDDGSPLTDLVGYYIYTGSSPDGLIPTLFCNTGTRSIVLRYAPGGTHYFRVSAVNVDGVESAMTPLVSKGS